MLCTVGHLIMSSNMVVNQHMHTIWQVALDGALCLKQSYFKRPRELLKRTRLGTTYMQPAVAVTTDLLPVQICGFTVFRRIG